MHAIAGPYLIRGETSFATLMFDLCQQAERVKLPARRVLYEPSDSASKVYFIEQGELRTHQVGPSSSRRLVDILGVGDGCGAAALAGLPRYGERAEAAVTSIVGCIPRERLFGRLVEYPAAAADLIRQLAGKLSAFRQEAAELIFGDGNLRLVRTLQRLSDSPAASPTPEGVMLRITHEQLAQAVGLARETVSLAISALRRKKLLKTGRNQLLFNPDDLETTISGN